MSLLNPTPEEIARGSSLLAPLRPDYNQAIDLADQGAGLRRVSDVGVDVLSGIAAIPQGFAALVPGLGGVSQGIGELRRGMGEALYSPQRQAEQARLAQELAQTEGFFDDAGTYLRAIARDPALGVGALAETLPAVFTGGAVARGVGALAPKLSAPVRAAIGEGTVAGALTAGAIGEEGGDYFQRLAGVPAGIATGLISGGSNRLIGKMAQQQGLTGAVGRGLEQAGDIDIALAGGAGAGKGRLLNRMALGGIREGVFEELPQSLSEQAITNLALGEDITEGLGSAAAGGLLLGSAMGAGFTGLRGTTPEPVPERYVPTRRETTELPEAGQEVERLSRAKREGVRTKSGELFKTEGAAKAALTRRGDNAADFDIIRTGGGTRENPTIGFTAIRREDAEGVDFETRQQAAAGEQASAEARQAARATLETELKGIKGIGKKSIDAVLNVKSAAELEALPTSVLSNSRKQTILNSDAFKTYVEQGGIPDFRGTDPKGAAPVTPAEFIDQDTAQQEAAPDRPTQKIAVEDELEGDSNELFDVIDPKDAGIVEPVKAKVGGSPEKGTAKAEAVKPKLINLGRKLTSTNFEEAFGTPMANSLDEVYGDPGTTARIMAQARFAGEFKRLGKQTLEVLLNVKSPEELVALPSEVISNADKAKILASDAFNEYTAPAGAADAIEKKLLTPDGFKALVQLMRGYTPAEGSRAATGKKAGTQASRNTIKLVNAVRRWLDTDNNAQSQRLVDAFEELHAAMVSYESILKVYPRARPLQVTGANELDIIDLPGPDFAAEQGTTFSDEELEQQEDFAKRVVSTPPEKSGLGVIPLEARTKRIADAINEIEQLVGRNNLRIAQYLAKRATARTEREVTSLAPTTREGETSPAIKFHIYNRRYREGRLTDFGTERNETRDAVDQAVEVPGIAPDEEVTYGYNSVVGQTTSGRPVTETNTPSLARQIDKRLAQKERDFSTPVGAMLAHYRKVSPSPYTRMLADHLIKIGERNGFFNNVELVIGNVKAAEHPEQAYGLLSRRAEGSPQYTLYLATDGQNESTVLHEVLHAVTRGTLTQQANQDIITALNAVRTDLLGRFKIVDEQITEFNREGVDPDLKLSPEELSRLAVILRESDKRGQMIDEFVSYGMTDPVLQKVMAATPMRDVANLVAARVGAKKNLWQFFVMKIKALLGIKAVPNSVLSSYMDATSALLSDIYARSDDSLTAFAFGFSKKGGKGNKSAIVKAAIDFNNLPPDMVAKSQSAKQKAAESNKGREKVNEDVKKFKEDEKKKRQDAAAEAEQARFDEVAAGKAETAVPQAKRKTRQDLTVFDQLGRTTMNVIANAFGKETWAQLMDGFGKWSADKFANFVSQENPLSAAVRAVVVGVVDKYGTTEQFRNLLHEYARNRQNVSATAYAAYETLRSMDSNAQQALVDYLGERDDDKLAKALNNPAHVDMVKKTVAGMEELLSEAKRLRVMREGQEDFTLDDILALSDNPRYRRMIDRAAGNVGISEAARAKNFKTATQSMDWVITKNGKQLSGLKPGRDFYKMYNATTGDTYFVEQGIDENLVRSKNLVPDMDDLLPYRTEKLLAQTDVRMSRRRTVEEMGTERNPIQVVASLTATMQDMSRRIEGARMNTAALVAQEGLKDAKWILDEEELKKIQQESSEEIPKGSLLDAGSKAMDPKELLRKARRPGTWVRIPEDASEWGDLQGKWMAGPAYASMEDYFSEEALVDAGVARTAMRTWKKFKTVYSPVAHMNNVMGNVILSYYHDLPAGNIAQAAQLIINGARGKLTGQDLKLYEEFMTSGATFGAFNVAEVSRDAQTSLDALGKNYKGKDGGIRNLVAVLTEMEGTFAKLAVGRDALAAGIRKGDAALADIYSNQDNVFRLAAYMTRIQQIRERKGGIDAADKDEAARFAKEAFVDYAITAPWIVAARNSVLPFVAWPYRMIPLLSKLMITKPWKAGATLGAVHVLNSIFTAMTGDDDDEEGRLLLDDYMQHNIWGVPGVPSYIRMPFGDEDNPVYFGVGRMIPLADVFNLANTGVPQTLAPAGPLYTLFNALNNYDPFRQQEIAGVTDTAAENFWKRFVYVGNDMLPQFIASGARTADKLGVLSSEQLGPLGSEPNAWVELSRVLGVNMRQVNMPEQQYKQTQEIRNLRREYGRARSAALRSELRRGNPNVDAIYREMLELNQRQIEALNAELGIID